MITDIIRHLAVVVTVSPDPTHAVDGTFHAAHTAGEFSEF